MLADHRDQYVSFERCLTQFLSERRAEFKHHRFATRVDTTAACVSVLAVSARHIIKTVVFRAEDGANLAVIVPGDRSVDLRAVKRLYGMKNLAMLDERGLLSRVGYPKGGVPPCGFDATFLIDTSLDLPGASVYAGGGSPFSLLELKVEELLRVSGGLRHAVSK